MPLRGPPTAADCYPASCCMRQTRTSACTRPPLPATSVGPDLARGRLYPASELILSLATSAGLAHYALTHGQPENALLHGLLPLHAASSGGSEQIVAMLIERGADVNAPRCIIMRPFCQRCG